ncbi:MAG: diadenylate cyclase CdaA [Candidatus Krumholzibacteriia bacterium]|nr:diadenylate cyclase CdaA [bacterium]MCB9516562.1 TIGR00159 family protein [Candidatus Latescibacterota bacterium]
MNELLFTVLNVLDILVVAFIFYRLYILVRGTRAALMLNGFLVILIASLLAQWIGLTTLNWILSNLRTVWVIAFIVLFQHELRSALAQLGRNRIVGLFLKVEKDVGYIQEITRAVEGLARSGLGALIVLEREMGLRNYAENGVLVNAAVNADLIETIFTPPSPLHDGAVIVNEGTLVAARVILPLSQDPNLSRVLGTRHRAAIGITEETDALVVVVSEETRTISLAEAGMLERDLDVAGLRKMLIAKLQPEASERGAAA